MKYILLFIPFTCFGQFWTDTIRVNDTNVKKTGEWRAVQGTDRYFPGSDDAIIEYTAWMQRIEVYTETFGPEYQITDKTQYIVSINNIDVDTVDISGTQSTLNKLTFAYNFSNRGSNNWNNSIKIRGKKFKYVINYMIKYVNYDPYYPRDTVECDTVFITDTLFIEKPIYIIDTVYIPADTIKIPQDTVYLQPKIFIIADSIKFEIE